MNFDKKHYYNVGRLPKLLHVSKNTFYSKVIQLENFPEVFELTATFKLVRKSEFDAFVEWYHDSYKKQAQNYIINLIAKLETNFQSAEVSP